MKEVLSFKKKSTEWLVFSSQEFSITVKNWTSKGFPQGYYEGAEPVDVNHWNVYLCVFEASEFFTKPQAIQSAPWHGGVTYDQVCTSAPSEGIKYDWQKDVKYYKFGSDYSHYMDHFEEYNAEDGIPPSIQYDVQELYNWLKGDI